MTTESTADTSEPALPLLFDWDSEQTILGAIFFNVHCMDIVRGLISSRDLFRESHQLIFDVMIELFDNGEPVENNSVIARLREHGYLDTAGGREYVYLLSDSACTASNVEWYCRKVAGLAARRRAQEKAREFILLAQDEDFSIESLQSQVTNITDALQTQLAQKRKSIITVQDAGSRVIERLERQRNDPFDSVGIRTDFAPLDAFKPCIEPTEFLALAAYESTGKTAFALYLAQLMLKAKRTIRIVSLEMTEEDLYRRFVTILTGYSQDDLRMNKLTDDQYEVVKAIKIQMDSWQLDFIVPAEPTIEFILQLLKESQRVNPADFIIIDNWNLIKRQKPTQNDHVDMKYISRECKNFTLSEYRCALMMLCQLNREGFNNKDGRPRMHNIGGSSALSKDADVVLMLHDKNMEDSSSIRELELIIAKNRGGRKGFENIQFDAYNQVFKAGGLGIGGSLEHTGY